MSDQAKPGYYLDLNGEWQKDRRKKPDRRATSPQADGDNRRRHARRASDREILDREHKAMIRDALDEFSAEHQRRSGD